MILDLMLPRRNGFEVLKSVKADASLRSLPVLVLTAKGQPQDRRRARRSASMPSSPSRFRIGRSSTRCAG